MKMTTRSFIIILKVKLESGLLLCSFTDNALHVDTQKVYRVA